VEGLKDKLIEKAKDKVGGGKLMGMFVTQFVTNMLKWRPVITPKIKRWFKK
jgi:hypothetical protein